LFSLPFHFLFLSDLSLHHFLLFSLFSPPSFLNCFSSSIPISVVATDHGTSTPAACIPSAGALLDGTISHAVGLSSAAVELPRPVPWRRPERSSPADHGGGSRGARSPPALLAPPLLPCRRPLPHPHWRPPSPMPPVDVALRPCPLGSCTPPVTSSHADHSWSPQGLNNRYSSGFQFNETGPVNRSYRAVSRKARFRKYG
jgi:hypothetical protein